MRWIRLGFALCGAVAASFWIAGCNSPTPAPVRLAAIDALPDIALPPFIAAVSPRGAVAAGAQVRVIFREDAVALEALEAPERQALLERFVLEPAVPGRFIVLTPRMIGFQADAPLPLATRFRVTLRAGLADLHGGALAGDYAWTFTTPAIELTTNLPTGASALLTASERSPKVTVNSNIALDERTLLEGARFIAAGGSTAAVAAALVPTPAPSGSARAAESGAEQPRQFSYVLQPSAALAPATAYRFELAPGILPLAGNLGSQASVAGLLRTYGPLAYARSSPRDRPAESGGDGRFREGVPAFVFTNVLDPKSIATAVHLDPAPRTATAPFAASDSAPEVLIDPAALEPHRRYTVTFDAALRDVFGQALGTAVTQAFETGDLAADLWAPAGQTIFPATRGIDLAVTTQNLPQPYRVKFATIEPRELTWFDPQDDDAIGKRLGDVSGWTPIWAPARPNEAVETRYDLRARLASPSASGATGMLAYGVTGRTNRYSDERARSVWAEPRFLGVVQLSNVGIFAQWFPNAGFVLLHHLSDGSPIVRGRVEIYESLARNEGARGAAALRERRDGRAGRAPARGPRVRALREPRDACERSAVAPRDRARRQGLVLRPHRPV